MLQTSPSAAAPYQILLSGVAILGVISLGTVFLLTPDSPSTEARAQATGAGRFGIVIHDRGSSSSCSCRGSSPRSAPAS